MPESDKKPRGFSGLIELASEIDESLLAKLREDEAQSRKSPPESPSYAPPARTASKTESNVPPPKKQSGNTGNLNGNHLFFPIMLAMFAVFVLIYIYYDPSTIAPGVSVSQNNASSPPSPRTETSTPEYSSQPPSASATSPASDRKEAPAPASQTYKKPAEGSNRILSVDEISWCLREEIRIEAIRDMSTTTMEVINFNRRIDDYNRRCGSYRYRSGDLDTARRRVEAVRGKIIAESTSEFFSQYVHPETPYTQSYSYDAPRTSLDDVPLSSPEDIARIQELLIDLGYNPGPADGIVGKKTTEAVKAFQKKAGLNPTGKISLYLLQELNNALKAR